MSPALDYGEVAALYDSYTTFTEDIPFFLDECRDTHGPILELMAGTGRVSVPLIEAGHELTCVDSSAEMLDILRARLLSRHLNAWLVMQDVTGLHLATQFELALMPFHSFAELLTDQDQRAALACVHQALGPGGRFVCTLHNPAVRLRSVDKGLVTLSRSGMQGGQGEVLLQADFRYDADEQLVHGRQIIQELDAAGQVRVERVLPVQFRLIGRAAFEALSSEAGFEIEALYGDYGRTAFSAETSPFMIWSLRRRD